MSGYRSNSKRSQNLSESKLKRALEHNQRLREQLDIPRIKVSEASEALIKYCNSTKDHLVPSVWGPVDRGADPYQPTTSGGCCIIM
ncbi:G-protein gamma subunit [Jimgerdemannia flammicorona]|uniref:Guanine nucleotide-binding protein subunit gamma n=1 Tax=Jimgerdemannia flammicorona TaxID=994334 RepID=A0A433Q7C0_9FUNG|nr:G-protein gamma subunit [Jimgerdemannia flammicorona]